LAEPFSLVSVLEATEVSARDGRASFETWYHAAQLFGTTWRLSAPCSTGLRRRLNGYDVLARQGVPVEFEDGA
jgi:hypothetical protein